MIEIISVEKAKELTAKFIEDVMSDALIDDINHAISEACKKGKSNCVINVKRYTCKTYNDACYVAQRLGKLGYNVDIEIVNYKTTLIKIDWSNE